MPTFSEPEQFLLKQWSDARLVEEAIKAVRAKYEGLFDQVLDEVQKNHRDLDCPKTYIRPTQSYIGLGKDSWPKNRWKWPSGCYLESIQLENIVSDEHYPPGAWISIQNENGLDWNEVERKLKDEGGRLLGSKRISEMEHGVYSEGGAWLGCKLKREELFRLLTEDAASGFVPFLVDHYEWMVKFVPFIDEIHAGKARRS